MDFGRPEYVSSRSFLQLIRCRLKGSPGYSYLFSKSVQAAKRGDVVKSYWRCMGCRKIRERQQCPGRVAVMHIVHPSSGVDVISTDPEKGHHPKCVPYTDAEVEGAEICQQAKLELKRSRRKRPLEAYIEMCGKVTQIKDGALQASIENALPPYKKIRRTLYRCSEVGARMDAEDLPQEYKKTLRGRNADKGSIYFGEMWLMFSSDLLLIFASDEDLEVLHNSEVWISDGTFKTCPDGFEQVHTILGYGQFQNEALPCVIAIMKEKSSQIYETFFDAVRNKLMAKFNSVGKVKTFLCDFEPAVIGTVEKIFPSIRIRGCAFHFSQALIRHAAGMRSCLSDKNHDLNAWLGKVRSLTLVPDVLVDFAWNYVLLPETEMIAPKLSQKEQNSLNSFVAYFVDTWLTGRHFPLQLWNHFTNDGPRTTNHAKGYHSLLSRNDIKETHSSLKDFLSKLQLVHNRYQQRIRRLKSGIDQASSQKSKYKCVHEKISNSRETFKQRTSHLWPQIRNLSFHEFHYLYFEIKNYLSYLRALTGT